MEGKMKVAVMTDIQKIEFEERPIPTPKDDEVLVKLDYVGICGSDLHYYETGAIGDFVVKPPFVLGHEPGGVVVEVGKNVKHLQVGDRVALEPGKTCGHCEFCKEGKYNLCPDVVFLGRIIHIHRTENNLAIRKLIGKVLLNRLVRLFFNPVAGHAALLTMKIVDNNGIGRNRYGGGILVPGIQLPDNHCGNAEQNQRQQQHRQNFPGYAAAAATAS